MQQDKIIIAISNITMLTHAEYGWLEYTNSKHKIKSEVDKFFWTISYYGANATRLLPYSSFVNKFDKKDMFQPYVYAGSGKWDISKFNDYYFDVLRNVIIIANSYNLTVWFDLFDNCQFFKGAKEYSPWANNIQGMNSYMDSLKYSKKWIDKILDIFKGLDVKYELGNELAPKIGMKASTKWAVEIVKYLLDKGVKPKDLTYGAMMQECENYMDGNCPIDFQSHIKGE